MEYFLKYHYLIHDFPPENNHSDYTTHTSRLYNFKYLVALYRKPGFKCWNSRFMM